MSQRRARTRARCWLAGLLAMLAAACGETNTHQLHTEHLAAKAGPRLVHRAADPLPHGTDLQLTTVWSPGRAPHPPGVGPCLGPICAARIEPAALGPLLARDDLVHARLAVRYRPRLDQAGAAAGLLQARQETGATGEGVLIAVIDTGLDWTHPDFIDDQGHTRVSWLLDQTRLAEGRHPELESTGGGAVYSAADLQDVLDGFQGPALGAGRDVVGHGTHVAGIAAGGDSVYTGAAPGARLVAVKAISADLSGFDEDRVIAALAFAARVSELEGKPLVVNLSLGTQLGGHDGSEPLEMALDTLATRSWPAAAVVVAGGNEAGLDLHARGAVTPDGKPLVFPVELTACDAPAPGRPARVVIDFWHSGNDAVTAKVVTPAGHATDAIGSAGPVGLDEWTPDGDVAIQCTAEPYPFNGLHRTLVTLSGQAGQELACGTWRVVFTGRAARVDGWIGEVDLTGGPMPRFGDHVDPGFLVGPPATGRHVIAVGAYTARAGWDDLEGRHWNTPGTPGELASFSSPGPTRDGRPKPEVTAPGVAVGAALSTDADPRTPQSQFYAAGSMRKVLPDGLHAVSSGTSSAAPLVAGAAAIAFEHDPSLSGAAMRSLFTSANATDGYTDEGALYATGWGFGKLDAWRPLRVTSGWPVAARADASTSLCGTSNTWMPPRGSEEVLALAVPRDALGLPLGPGLPVVIETSEAVWAGPVQDLGFGLYARRLAGGGRRGSDARIHCSLGGVRFSAAPRVRLAASYGEANRLGLVGGAGHCGGGRTAPPLMWLFAATLWMLCRLRNS